MSFKKILMTATALALLGGNAFADGGPVPEPPAPPPEPAAPPSEPAPPPPEEEHAPPPPAPFAHWYVGLHGGAVWTDDLEFERPGGLLGPWFTDLDSGWGAGGALGYRWENGLRGELEATWRRNDGILIDSGFPGIPDDVEVDSVSVMVNVLYDIDMGTFLIPYLGFGLGGTNVNMDRTPSGSEDDGWAFAYQFLGGLSVPMPNTSFELFADYRYLSTSGLELDFGAFFDDNDEYHTHSVMGGIRFNF